MDHFRILAFVAQINAAERARLAREKVGSNPARALFLQSIAAAYYRRARALLGIES